MSAMPPPPPASGGMASSAGMPQNYMVASIIGTILGLCTTFCIGAITGIIAIIYGNKVKTLWAAGDSTGAQAASNTAKIFMIVTWAIILVGVLINIILVATGNFYYSFSTS